MARKLPHTKQMTATIQFGRRLGGEDEPPFEFELSVLGIFVGRSELMLTLGPVKCKHHGFPGSGSVCSTCSLPGLCCSPRGPEGTRSAHPSLSLRAEALSALARVVACPDAHQDRQAAGRANLPTTGFWIRASQFADARTSP